MKEIRNITIQRIELEDFGFLEIEENRGEAFWTVKFRPNDHDGLRRIYLNFKEIGGTHSYFASDAHRLLDAEHTKPSYED